jgi:hypothetical protein
MSVSTAAGLAAVEFVAFAALVAFAGLFAELLFAAGAHAEIMIDAASIVKQINLCIDFPQKEKMRGSSKPRACRID